MHGLRLALRMTFKRVLFLEYLDANGCMHAESRSKYLGVRARMHSIETYTTNAQRVACGWFKGLLDDLRLTLVGVD